MAASHSMAFDRSTVAEAMTPLSERTTVPTVLKRDAAVASWQQAVEAYPVPYFPMPGQSKTDSTRMVPPSIQP